MGDIGEKFLKLVTTSQEDVYPLALPRTYLVGLHLNNNRLKRGGGRDQLFFHLAPTN